MTLESRIERLERENRLMKRMALAVVVTASLAIFMGQAKPDKDEKVLQASRFQLLDKEGKVRAEWAMENGGPSLTFNDSEGRQAVSLQVPKIPDKAALYLFDPNLSTMTELSMTQNGPVLHFNDKTGNRIRLATNELNAPLLAVYDAEGEIVLKASAKE